MYQRSTVLRRNEIMEVKGRIVSHYYTDVLVIRNCIDFMSLSRHSVLLFCLKNFRPQSLEP